MAVSGTDVYTPFLLYEVYYKLTAPGNTPNILVDSFKFRSYSLIESVDVICSYHPGEYKLLVEVCVQQPPRNIYESQAGCGAAVLILVTRRNHIDASYHTVPSNRCR